MDNFLKSIQFILENEGGYSNSPNDKGGETYMGISRKYNPMWEGWKIIDEAKEESGSSTKFIFALGTHEIYPKVLEFYKKNYWEPLKLDKVNILRVATKILDISVNLGVSRTASMVQICINLIASNELVVDNIIGSATVNLLNAVCQDDNGEFLLKLLTLQQGYVYMKLCQLDSSQEKFIRGWINRLHMTIGEF